MGALVNFSSKCEYEFQTYALHESIMNVLFVMVSVVGVFIPCLINTFVMHEIIKKGSRLVAPPPPQTKKYNDNIIK